MSAAVLLRCATAPLALTGGCFCRRIGGDGQSTEATEASHMHSRDDENYERGCALPSFSVAPGWPNVSLFPVSVSRRVVAHD